MNTTTERATGAGLAAANCSPVFALSIRQPWAWLILNAGKNIENRTWPTRFRGRVLIHASKGCTQSEWADAHYFMNLRKLGADVPEIKDLERGGIVGECEIVDCVTNSNSPWFVGQYGFVLRNVKPLQFRACKGALGFFNPGNEKLTDHR